MPLFAQPAQLRVMPTSPTVDRSAFAAGPTFKDGTAAFEQGAKLPLLMETIKHEKKRLKMENAKLDFAMSDAGQQQAQGERNMASDAATAKLQVDIAQAIKLKADADATNAKSARERGMGTDAAQQLISRVTGTSPPGTVPATLPLDAAEISTTPAPPFSYTGNAAVFNRGVLASEGVPPAVEAPDPFKYVPTHRDGDPFTGSVVAMPLNADGSIDEPAFRTGWIQSVYGDSLSLREAVEAEVALLKDMANLEPVNDVSRAVDDRGIPMIQNVTKRGGNVVGLVGPARIDVKTLHAENDSVKTLDNVFAKRKGEKEHASVAQARQNVKNLGQAIELLNEVDKDGIISPKILGFLPKKVTDVLGPKVALSRDRIYAVIQQTLRETLGAQFARIEGEMMMERSFNMLQDTQANYQTISNALAVAETALRDQDAALGYWKTNGTLAGYTSPVGLVDSETSPTLQRLEELMVGTPKTTKQGPSTNNKAARESSFKTLQLRNRPVDGVIRS